MLVIVDNGDILANTISDTAITCKRQALVRLKNHTKIEFGVRRSKLRKTLFGIIRRIVIHNHTLPLLTWSILLDNRLQGLHKVCRAVISGNY